MAHVLGELHLPRIVDEYGICGVKEGPIQIVQSVLPNELALCCHSVIPNDLAPGALLSHQQGESPGRSKKRVSGIAAQNRQTAERIGTMGRICLSCSRLRMSCTSDGHGTLRLNLRKCRRFGMSADSRSHSMLISQPSNLKKAAMAASWWAVRSAEHSLANTCLHFSVPSPHSVMNVPTT